MSAFLWRFKANYLEKMRGYPWFSLWFPMGLAKIYFFHVVETWRKNLRISRHRPKSNSWATAPASYTLLVSSRTARWRCSNKLNLKENSLEFNILSSCKGRKSLRVKSQLLWSKASFVRDVKSLYTSQASQFCSSSRIVNSDWSIYSLRELTLPSVFDSFRWVFDPILASDNLRSLIMRSFSDERGKR